MNSVAIDLRRTREDDRPRGLTMFQAPSAISDSTEEWAVRAVSLGELSHAGAALGGRVRSAARAVQRTALQDYLLKRREASVNEREVKLYREELRKLRIEQRNEGRQLQAPATKTTTYLDEAMALAHPIAFRLLAWLNLNGETELQRVFDFFGASSSTFEGVARLHLMGAVRFDDGKVEISTLGTDLLRAFGFNIQEDAARGR